MPPLDAPTSPPPIDQRLTHLAVGWLRSHFEPNLKAIADFPFTPQVLCAIACKETGAYWCDWLFTRHLTLSAQDVLARCLGDAGPEDDNATVGAPSGRTRAYFPGNTQEFRNRFGDNFTKMLIDETNKTRALRLRTPVQWLYMGYGLFQFDLQYSVSSSDFGDEAFFREKHWYDINSCLSKAKTELDAKLRAHPNLWDAVEAYNGVGHSEYRKHVQQLHAWIVEAWPEDKPAPRS
jgi:hypothetical protein